MVHLLNVVRWALVAFLFYVAALMQEEQEGRWENKLQEWLKGVYSRQVSSYAKITALAKAVADISEKFTERLFGRRLFSLRFLGVSIFYGLASVNLTVFLSPLISRLGHTPLKFPPGAPRPEFFMSFVWFVLFVVLGSTPALLQHIEMKNWFRWVWYIWLFFFLRWMFPLIVVVKIVDLKWGRYSAIRFALGILMLVGVNFLLDVVFVATERWTLRIAANARHLPGVLLAIVLDIALGCAVIVGPLWLGVELIAKFHGGMISFALMLVFALKSLDFLLAFIALIIFLAIAAHFVIWFVLERPVYAVLRFSVIRDKKLLRNIILALTVLPNVGSVWAFAIAILKAF